MSTRDAGESSLIGSVLFVDTAARGALPGCVAWINEDHRDASALRFVRDECAKLAESPVPQSRALDTISGRDPLADALESLKADPPYGAFGIQHDSFGDAMIGVFLEPRLSAGELTQAAFRGFGSTRLQAAPAFLMVAPLFLNISARVNLAVAVHCQGDDAQLVAGAILALFKKPESYFYDSINQGLVVCLNDSFTDDPIWGKESWHPIY